MFYKKYALTTLATLSMLGAGAASAHPGGHAALSGGELLEHLSGSPFHIGIALAVAVTVAIGVRGWKASRNAGKSEASHE
jgi:hypothetical protein